jgi:invasion protein IalB
MVPIERRDVVEMHFIRIVALGAVLGVFVAGMASAQTQGEPGVEPKPQMQAPAVQSTRFDDWHYRCVDVKATNGEIVQQCEVAQVAQVKQGEENINVLTLAIARTAPEAGKKASDGDLLLTALVPLNVVLPIGLGLSADGREVVAIPYRNCNQAGCWAQQKLDQKMLRALQKGISGEAHLRLMNGQNINLRFSLRGLTKALVELQKPSNG